MKWSHANIIIGASAGAREVLLNEALDCLKPMFTHKYGEEGPVGIAQLREIRRKAYIAVPNARQAFILYGADAMASEASNALLKIFEEPPQGSVFILLASSRSALRETILSRASVFYAHRRTPDAGEAKKDYDIRDRKGAEQFFESEIAKFKDALESSSTREKFMDAKIRLAKCLEASEKLYSSNVAPRYIVELYEMTL